VAEAGKRAAEERRRQLEHDQAHRDEVPLRAARFMEELAPAPADTIVFDEALTTSSPDLTRYLARACPTTSSRRAAARSAWASRGSGDQAGAARQDR
jgi:hypothetical protein